MGEIANPIGKIYSIFKAKNRDLILDIGEKILRQLEKLVAHYSLVGDSPFFDPYLFSWVVELESNWMLIRQELDLVIQHRDELPNFQDISTDQYSITKDNLWKTYFFYAYGIKLENNCARCPQTNELLTKIPGMKTAFFSILLPNKHIQAHSGPYKGLLRYHLGLIVPQEKTNCKIRVKDRFAYWQEGKSLLFDDRYEHEVWNNTDEVRVVLFMDVVRPLPFPLSWLNEVIIKLIANSPFIQDAKVNQEKWDAKLDKLFDNRQKN